MSDETRDQFRKRLFMTARNAYSNRDYPAYAPALMNAAISVYDAALRDVLALMHDREIVVGEFAVTIPALTDHELTTYSAERGIDLED